MSTDACNLKKLKAMKMTSRELVSCALYACLLVALLKIFHGLWWVPTRLQRLLWQRGLRGPPCRSIHGNTKEIVAMHKEAMARPLALSDHRIFPKLQPHVHCWANSYGKSFVQWDGRRAQLVVTDAELVKEVLTDRDGAFSKGETKPFLRRLLGNGLVTSEGEKWATVRKLANHAFHGHSLKRMLPAMIESVETMLERWKHREGKEVEVYEEFRLLSSEVISRTAFGSSYLEGKKIFEIMTEMTLLASTNTYKQTLPVLGKLMRSNDEIESDRLEKAVRESILELIRKKEEEAINGDEETCEGDFLGLLVKAFKSKTISIDDVVDECKTFFFAGQETTNSLLAWTVFLLAIHEDWQEAAREEVVEILGKRSSKFDDLPKLKTMSMIINESLRLYPPVISMLREVKRGTKLGDFHLPENMKLFVSNLAIHHDVEVWGRDAHLFRPERFAKGMAKATNNNTAAFLPFGLGPRNCVGFNFAIAEAKIALAMILQRYAFTLSSAYVHSPVQVFTVRPQHGIQVLLRLV